MPNGESRSVIPIQSCPFRHAGAGRQRRENSFTAISHVSLLKGTTLTDMPCCRHLPTPYHSSLHEQQVNQKEGKREPGIMTNRRHHGTRNRGQAIPLQDWHQRRLRRGTPDTNIPTRRDGGDGRPALGGGGRRRRCGLAREIFQTTGGMAEFDVPRKAWLPRDSSASCLCW